MLIITKLAFTIILMASGIQIGQKGNDCRFTYLPLMPVLMEGLNNSQKEFTRSLAAEIEGKKCSDIPAWSVENMSIIVDAAKLEEML